MTIILAKNFKFRSDLENYVRNKIGLTPDPKPDYTIEGTREELARLQLSDRNLFWGIGVSITDMPTEIKEFAKPDRGEIKETSLDGKKVKPPKLGSRKLLKKKSKK